MSSELAHDLPREVALLIKAGRALAEARTVDEVKDIRDKAEALRHYLKQQGESKEIQFAATEIKVRAERRAGELLIEMQPSKGRPAKEMSHDATFSRPPTLDELGIERDASSRWQSIARIPEDTFEEEIASTRSADKELTSAAMLRLARQFKPSDGEPKSPPPWTVEAGLNQLHRALYPVVEAWPAEHLAVLASRLRAFADELDDTGEICP